MEDCVLDTMVLQKANARLTTRPREKTQFALRVRLLQRIANGELRVLISPKLLSEYRRQVVEPRNDFVSAFLELVTDASRHRFNWAILSGTELDQTRKCRFPREDLHVLRTAVLEDERSTLFSEEKRILASARCILRHFRVAIRNPVSHEP